MSDSNDDSLKKNRWNRKPGDTEGITEGEFCSTLEMKKTEAELELLGTRKQKCVRETDGLVLFPPLSAMA